MRFIFKPRYGGRFALDVLLSGLAFCLVTAVPLLARYGLSLLFQSSSRLAIGLVAYMAAAGLAFYVFGSYRMIWRYVSFRDVFNLIGAVTLAVLIFFVGQIGWAKGNIPVSGALLTWAGALLWTATLACVVAPRLIVRFVAERQAAATMHNALAANEGAPIPVLVTGNVGRIDTFIRECSRRSESRYKVVGVFTSDKRLHGSNLNGVKVFGTTAAIPDALRELSRRGIKPGYLVQTDDKSSQEELAHLLDLLTGTEIRVGRLPRLNAFQDDAPVRPIVLSDLLGRPEVAFDKDAASSLIKDNCVMITGAGGSIGSELCRQISSLEPSQVILVDFGEFNLYAIDRELHEMFPNIDYVTALADVRDPNLIANWINATKPKVVFHAAALKHVPLLEGHPIEAVKTNVFGTANVADACRANGVRAMVTISTDKAVNPTNAMGATKRLAEAYCQGLDQASDGDNETRFITVRFGNVLGSAGSVVPLFERQIEHGGPVTVTHRDICRYFMTIPEAVTLILQAGAQAQNLDHERASIYVLDMGEPIKIMDLASQMIRLSGRRPGIDIKVEIVGLRPGEKLYEEVVHSDETLDPTAIKSVLKAAPRFTNLHILRQQMRELRDACADNDCERVLRILKLSVPEYVAVAEKKVAR